MPGTRTTTRQADRRREVARLYLQGNTQSSISRVLHVTQACVSKDLTWLRAEWLARAGRSTEELVQEELAKILTVEHAAWQSYARSLLASTRTVQAGDKVSTTTEARAGSSCWLDVILRCCERRASLLGLDKAKKYQIDFDSLTDFQLEALARGENPSIVLSMPAPAPMAEA